MQCKPVQSFGKKHLEDVEPVVNTLENVSPWCSVDTSSGNLTVVLEPFNCFDAELYADELVLDEPVDFREDQRSKLIALILCIPLRSLTQLASQPWKVDSEVPILESYR